MPNRDALNKEIALIESLQTLVTTYEEIAVMRIQKIRQAVLSTRAFREGLSHVFANVKQSHDKEIAQILAKKKKSTQKENSSRPSLGAVLISTDKRLSGSITSIVFKQFLKFVNDNSCEIIITGSVGKDLFTKAKPETKFFYFNFSEKHTANDFKGLLTHLRKYDKVIIYYGYFINLVEQIPLATDLLGEYENPAKKHLAGNNKKSDFFLFEPSLDEVVHFFHTRIFAMLFKQVINESHLAQLGSRITAMEKASHNIEKKLGEITLEERQLRRTEKSSKQRQRLAGMALWH